MNLTTTVRDRDLAGEPLGLAAGRAQRPRRRRPPVLVIVAVIWLAVVILAAVFASHLPIPEYGRPVGPPKTSPFQLGDAPLGTDKLGRSMLSRLIFGARASLAVSIVSVVIGLVIGGALGLIAGYFRKTTDRLIMILTDAVLAVPALVVLLALAAMFQPSLKTLIIGLSVVATPSLLRIARANTIAVASRDFVLMARALGARSRRILFRELLPNVAVPLQAYAFLVIAVLIVAEGSLSFLGLGIPPPTPSWGGMIADGRPDLRTDPYLVLVPSIAMFLTVYALNVIGDWARSRLDAGG